MKNCPNCGAPIELNSGDFCPYCDTPYYDLSCIPMNKPFILRLNIGDEKSPKVVCAKVITTGASITSSVDSHVVGYGSGTKYYIDAVPRCTFDMSFESCGDVKYKEN